MIWSNVANYNFGAPITGSFFFESDPFYLCKGGFLDMGLYAPGFYDGAPYFPTQSTQSVTDPISLSLRPNRQKALCCWFHSWP